MSLSTLLSSWAARFSVSSGETAQWPGWIVLIASLGLFALLVYKISLPRPIPGIPHNALAATSILGDIPEMLSHMRETPSGDFVSYISESMFRLNSPLIQVFVRPLSLKGNRPMLVLGDARETQDILLRRSREFDRSPSMGDIVRGIAPSHHIHLRSEDAVFKAQRRLIQDLMTTGFLRDIAGPIIHRSSELLIELWRLKCQAAKERPFEASGDLSSAVIDAITSFAFGNAFRDQHSATRPAIEMMRHYLREKSSNNEAVSTTIHDPQDEPVVFPDGTLDEVLQAILDLRETGGELQGNPFPRLTWAYLMRKPRISNAWRIKEKWFGVELALAADRMQQSEGSIKHNVSSAVDHMVRRERELAEKQGRAPNYQSRVLLDEVFGFVFAGHDTTSTSLSWAVKLLADHPAVQSQLRHTLRSSFEAKGPSFDAINAPMPYLDAVLEEVLRCSPTAPIVDRIATVDTEILGHRVPKGTVVTFLTNGPSILRPGFPVDDELRSPTSRTRKDKNWDPRDMASFRPERWLHTETHSSQGESATFESKFDGTAGPMLAFGQGPRGCYGKKLAYLQLRVVLAMITYNFELLPCPPSLSTYEAELVGVEKPLQCYVTLREIISRGDE